jgi:hypothetical protein
MPLNDDHWDAPDLPDPADLLKQLETEAAALVAFLEPIDLATQLEMEDHARLD